MVLSLVGLDCPNLDLDSRQIAIPLTKNAGAFHGTRLHFYKNKWAERDSNSHDQRPPHFECGASTNFAIRPWQDHHYNGYCAFVEAFDSLECCATG